MLFGKLCAFGCSLGRMCLSCVAKGDIVRNIVPIKAALKAVPDRVPAVRELVGAFSELDKQSQWRLPKT